MLLGLSDGQVIDVGRVVGPSGETGERGAAGLPGERGVDGAAVLSGPRAPQADDGVEGDHWIDISSAEFSFFKKDGDGWTKLANLRQPAVDPRVGPVSGDAGSSGSGSANAYTTSNLPMTGLGRSGEGKAGGISKPGGNIIPKATNLKFQSNFNRWAVESLDALDQALPVAKVDELPDEGKYEGDMVLHDGSLHIWIDDAWVAIGGGVAPNPGKESKPWIQINSWGMRRSPMGQSPIYECSWNCNSNAIYTWQYEIDVDGDNNWIDIAEHPQKDDLGFSPGGEFPNQLTLANTSQEERYPNALMRYRITAELNSLKNELSSGAIAAWEVRHDDYEPPLYEDGTAVDLEPYATTEYVDEKVEEYLPLKGGTLGGALSCTRPGSTAAGTYLFSVKAEGLEDGKQVAFRVTADGAVKAGHDTGHPFMAKAKNDVVTKQYLDQQIAAIPAPEIPEVGGGVVFTEKYNGNRYYKQGLDTTGLEDGEVMFCSNGASTTMFAAITHVCLPEAGIDWTKFTKIGTIEVRNGATHCGHLQVISAMNNPGRNWKVKVKVLDVENNELAPESGHPCYFWGMFTG